MKNKKTIAIWAVGILIALFVAREIMTSSAVRSFFTPSPNDLVETSTPGVFVRQGMSASRLSEPTEFSGTTTNFPPGIPVLVAKCTDTRKRIDVTVTTGSKRVVYWFRLDKNPRRLIKFIATNQPVEEVDDENSSELSRTEIDKGFHTVEVIVEPGQQIEWFEVSSVIGPRLER
jgi:hypothetical protein